MFWKLTALSSSSPSMIVATGKGREVLNYGDCSLGMIFNIFDLYNLDWLNLVEAVLDKDNFTLEELLDEEEIIQECKALNSRLINLYSLPQLPVFLRDRAQVEQLLQFIVEDPPEDADSKRTFKFPFIASEIFTCEIDVILKTLVEEELMNLLFSFLEPNRHHSALLAGYFSKVVVCLMLRKTVSLMNYVEAHQDVFKQLVDLIGITSIMEVLVRLVGADDHLYPNSLDVMQWLADSNLLEMIVDKLNTSNLPEVHANAAETLCAITRNAPSPLATKLSSPSFVERVFGHALEDSHSKSALVHALSVCISLLDPKRSISSSVVYSVGSQHVNEPPAHVNPDAVGSMLPKLDHGRSPRCAYLGSHESDTFDTLPTHVLESIPLFSILLNLRHEPDTLSTLSDTLMDRLGADFIVRSPLLQDPLIIIFEEKTKTWVADSLNEFSVQSSSNTHAKIELLMLLNVSCDEKILPTTYGELRPPLGLYRLKIVEFLAVLLKTGNEVAEKELVVSGTIQRVLDLFFEYPYNNALHHHVESIIYSCLESKNSAIVDHLLLECNLVGRILQSDKSPTLSGELKLPTMSACGRYAPRAGYFGHLTRIANKLVQLGNSAIQTHLQENSEWNEWRTTVLQERGMIENIFRWACGRPTALQDRTQDSDEEDVHDRDYDVAALANNLSQAFRYNIYDNDHDAEGHGSLDRDDEDVYFNDESAEVVISSLRLGDDQGSLFTNSNWFAFQDDRVGDNAPMDTSPSDTLDDLNMNGGNSSSDDEVVVGDDMELTKTSTNDSSISDTNPFTEFDSGVPVPPSTDLSFFRYETQDNDDPFGDRPIPEWVAWGETSDVQFGRSSVNPFDDVNDVAENHVHSVGINNIPSSIPNGTSSSDGSTKSDSSQKNVVPSLFEEGVEFVGVELEGTERAMEQALKEGIVGEAGPLKRNLSPKKPETEGSDDGGAGLKEFNDTNYWRVDQEVTVLE
ncbi:hypothetical protein OROHE_021358 [Orobanche hederae]